MNIREHIQHLIEHHTNSDEVHFFKKNGLRCIIIFDNENYLETTQEASPTRAHVTRALQPCERACTHAHIYTRVHACDEKSINTKSNRRSTPGEVKISEYKKKENKNHPTEKEWNLSKLIMKKISDNYPGVITETQLTQKIEAGAITIHKLSKEYEFKLIQDVMLWAVEDAFWKKQFRSIARITESSKQNGNTKFENMAMAYQISTKSEDDELSDHIEKYVSSRYQNQDKHIISQVLDDILWFQDELDKICLSLSKTNRFYWYIDMRFFSVVRWLVELDFKIVQQKDIDNFQGLMKRYLEFLNNKLQKGDISTLHAGMFHDKSALFRIFVDDLSSQWGRSILQ